MPYSIIDSKSETRTIKFLGKSETITTTIQLVEIETGKFGALYSAQLSGYKPGNFSGGPEPVDGNFTKDVNEDPLVTVIVSNFSKTAELVSMHITITVKIPVLGTKTIFDQTLGGKYGVETLQALVDHLKAMHKKTKV